MWEGRRGGGIKTYLVSLVLRRCSCTGLASVGVAMACRSDELVYKEGGRQGELGGCVCVSDDASDGVRRLLTGRRGEEKGTKTMPTSIIASFSSSSSLSSWCYLFRHYTQDKCKVQGE